MPPFLLGVDTEPMEAKSVETLPIGEHWQFEPKWDGFRCLVFKAGREVDLRAKSGKSLSRYFPEMVEAVRSINAEDFVLDGELMVPLGDTLSFGALQDRVHPANSRVAKLSVETPALLILFDCLATAKTGSLLGAPLAERRPVLEQMMAGFGKITRTRLSPQTRDLAEAQQWLDDSHGPLRQRGVLMGGPQAARALRQLSENAFRSTCRAAHFVPHNEQQRARSTRWRKR